MAIAASDRELGSGVPTTAAGIAVICAPGSLPIGSPNGTPIYREAVVMGSPMPSPGPGNVPRNCAGVMVLSNMNPVTLAPMARGDGFVH
jgi:hypothetical protein